LWWKRKRKNYKKSGRRLYYRRLFPKKENHIIYTRENPVSASHVYDEKYDQGKGAFWRDRTKGIKKIRESSGQRKSTEKKSTESNVKGGEDAPERLTRQNVVSESEKSERTVDQTGEMR